MIRKRDEQSTELRENVCEGVGKVHVRNIFEPAELKNVRLLNHILVEPGATFGVHTHHDEAEIYYILKGRLVTGEAGGRYELLPGDATYTGDNSFHYLENVGDEPAELIAVIVGDGSVTMGTPDGTAPF